MTENLPHTRGIIAARLVIAVVVVVAALVGGAAVELVPVVVLGGIVVVLTAVYLVWARLDRHQDLHLYVQLGIDVVLITVLAHLSGGLASPFKLLYFLPVIVASARLGAAGGVGTAAASVGGHLVLMLARRNSWQAIQESGTIAETAILLVSLGLVAVLVGSLARRARRSEGDLASAQSDLGTAELRLSNIIDSVGSGLVLVDGEGQLVSINRTGREILGVEEPPADARDYRVVFAEVPAFCERISSALDAGRAESRAEFYVRRPHGGNMPVGLSTSILRSDETDERGVIALFQDLTNARRLEERARHEDRLAALGQFAAGLAHEIRSPLNAIKGSIDLLREMRKPKGDEAKLVALVSKEADRLNKLLDEVLQFGRMESAERTSVRLDELLREVATIARTHPSYARGIELEIDSPVPVECFANGEQIRRALLNLTINALEAIDAEGRVRLSVVERREFGSRGLEGGAGFGVALMVEDTGCGIPMDKRDEFFQPFRTTKCEGTGLGLAIVEKIIEAHEGHISIASEPGRGSRFVVYLPD